jgi:hypothetical protein
MEKTEQAEAAIARVRALHCDLGSGICEECSTAGGLRTAFVSVPHPCRTVQALEVEQ